MNNLAPAIALIGVLIFLSHVFTAVFNRTRVPDVLMLICVGIVLGPILGFISPSLFGVVGPVFVSVTLIVILFEGGLALRLDTLRAAAGGAMSLAIVSFFVTMGVVAWLAMVLIHMELVPALILGAILGSTSEAIVIPLASQLGLGKECQTVLSIESSANDVLSVVITIALIEAQKLGKFEVLPLTSKLLASFLVAIVIGIAGALAWSFFLRRVHAVKNSALTTPAFLLVIYGVVEILGFNGAIASLAYGVTIGNIDPIRLSFLRRPHGSGPVGLTKTEKTIFSEMAFLLRTFFFVYLGISMKLTDVRLAVVGAALVAAVFIVRVPIVRFMMGRTTSSRDISMIAIMVPKGLAAAVLASIPAQQGIVGGDAIRNVAYAVILFSIVLTSVLVLLIDKTRFASVYAWLLSRGVRAKHMPAIAAKTHSQSLGDTGPLQPMDQDRVSADDPTNQT